jgi:hypothetical protein
MIINCTIALDPEFSTAYCLPRAQSRGVLHKHSDSRMGMEREQRDGQC